jgi:hypothetical protein
LGVVNNWSRVGSESVSPGIGFLLSGNSSGSSGFGISVGLEDGSRKNTVVEGVTIWVGSSLVKTVWVSDSTGVISPSVSPDISSLLFINGSLSSSLSIGMCLEDRGRKDSVVVGVSIWNCGLLHKSIWVSDWTSVVSPSVSPGIGNFLFVNSSLSNSLSIGVGIED